jgi:hypothetical protein
MTISSVKTGAIGDSLLAGNAAFIPTDYESIATANPSGTTVTFSSIPSTYKSLQIRGLAKDSIMNGDTLVEIGVRFNGDTGSNYVYHSLTGNGSTASASGVTGQAQIIVSNGNLRELSSSSTFGASIIDVVDYASTTKNKTLRYMAGVDTNSSNGSVGLGSGLWLNTAAITSITLFSNNTTFKAGSTWALYGIKGA